MACRRFTLGIIQLKVGANKVENINRAVNLIQQAKIKGSNIVALPECFNSPYGTSFFKDYAEEIPLGETSQLLSKTAKEQEVYLVGGSIPERDGSKLYNTCTVWSPKGELIAKHRKVHLFDINIPNGVRFMESETLSPGDSLTTFKTDFCKIGIGICYDVRFEEMARIYRNEGCDMILYPGAFNMTTGPLHWDLLMRCRAVDSQSYVAGIAPAQNKDAGYKSFGHSLIVSPWGKILTQAEYHEELLIAEINLDEVKEMREQIPTAIQRRHDLYETICKK